MYVNIIKTPGFAPVLKVEERLMVWIINLMFARIKQNFKRPCGGGNVEACRMFKKIVNIGQKLKQMQQKEQDLQTMKMVDIGMIL